MVVNMIYANHQKYTGWYVPLGVFFFAIQLYTDFSGCMDVVIGVSHMLGIELPENFNVPFLSKTVKEYWRRWHITLGGWLRDYLMYPLLKSEPLIKLGDWSKAKFGKKNGKKIPTYVALFVLWFAVGYWHGGLWNYVIGSGILHFIYIVLGIGCHVILYRFAGFPVYGSTARLMFGLVLFIFAMEALGITLIGLLPTLRDALSIGALYSMLGFSLSGFTYPQMAMLPPVKAISYMEPLRHYYLIYVNEALMAAPVENSIPYMLALTVFMLASLCVAPRLHRALVYWNYPLK
jgi:hypothetical protein